MAHFETAWVSQAYRARNEDRVAILEAGDRTVIVVADGAGGIGDGEVAAQTVVDEVGRNFEQIASGPAWRMWLEAIDQRIGSGESTAVVVDLRPDSICGASVGDSEAWIISDGELNNLTANQIRKPLLGSSAAQPVGFSWGPLAGTLLVASDGFCNYVKQTTLLPLVAQSDLLSLPRKCVELVRLPSGEFWDDASVVICRIRRIHRPKQRFTI